MGSGSSLAGTVQQQRGFAFFSCRLRVLRAASAPGTTGSRIVFHTVTDPGFRSDLTGVAAVKQKSPGSLKQTCTDPARNPADQEGIMLAREGNIHRKA